MLKTVRRKARLCEVTLQERTLGWGDVLKRKSDLELRWGLGGGVVLAYEQKLP